MKTEIITIIIVLTVISISGFSTIALTGATDHIPNHYIELIADAGGEGNSWDEAFNFKKIVDYFTANPLGTITYPTENDSTEDSDWTWYWGTYALATQQSNKNDATIEVDNTTGFDTSGQIRNLQSYVDDYVNYTNISGNNFTNCTWGNYIYTSGVTIKTNNEMFQIKEGTWENDTADKQVGSGSMKYTHNNNGSRVLVMANAKFDNVTQYADATRDMYSAEKLGFWLKVNTTWYDLVNQNITQSNGDEISCAGDWDPANPCPMTYDDDYYTYGTSGVETGSNPGGSSTVEVYINYTIPAHAFINETYWHTKDSVSTSDLIVASDCLTGSKLQLRIQIDSTNNNINWNCKNSGGFWTILAQHSSSDQLQIYEEDITWNVSDWNQHINPNVTLEAVETRDGYSKTYPYQYGKEIPINQTITNDSWVWYEFDFRDEGLGIKRSSRDWQNSVDSFILRFSNMSEHDIVHLDGVKWWIDNPNPREIKPNVYLFPIGIDDNQNQNYDFYFWDYGHDVIFNMPVGNAFYHYERNHNNYIRFGYEGAGYPTSANPQGETIFWNTWCNGYINFFFLGDSSHLDYNTFQMYGTHFMSADSSLGGISPRLNGFGYENNVIQDSIIEEGGDFFADGFKVLNNVQLKMQRYSPWSPPKDDAEVYNVKNWLNQNYMWADTGTLRSWEIASARNHAGYYWISGRSYGHYSETEVDMIDNKYPDGFWNSTADYTFHWTIYDTYASSSYNYPHWWKVGNSVQIITKDSDGNPIVNASVVVKDKNGTIVWNGTTDANGETERFNTFWRQTYISKGDGTLSVRNIYLYNKDNDKDYDWGYATGWTHTFNPFTVEVSKSNYHTVTWVDDFNKTDSIDGYTITVGMTDAGSVAPLDINCFPKDESNDFIFAEIIVFGSIGLFLYSFVRKDDTPIYVKFGLIVIILLIILAILLNFIDVNNITTNVSMNTQLVDNVTTNQTAGFGLFVNEASKNIISRFAYFLALAIGLAILGLTLWLIYNVVIHTMGGKDE